MAKKLSPAMREALVSLSNTGAHVQESAIFGPRIVGALPDRSTNIKSLTLYALVDRGLVAKRSNTITESGRKALLEN